VLFTAVGPQGPNSASVDILSLEDGTRTPVVQGGTFGRYVADGYLTYVNQGTLFAAPFDHNRIAPASATPIPVLSDVSYSSTFGFAQFDVSNTGTFVFRRSAARGQLVPTWIEPSGEAQPLRLKARPNSLRRGAPTGACSCSAAATGCTGSMLLDRVKPHG
jgi:hypothetical protein